jgi:hypothetical protein
VSPEEEGFALAVQVDAQPGLGLKRQEEQKAKTVVNPRADVMRKGTKPNVVAYKKGNASLDDRGPGKMHPPESPVSQVARSEVVADRNGREAHKQSDDGRISS